MFDAAAPETIPSWQVRGRISIWEILQFARILHHSQANQLQHGWGAIITEAVGRGNRDFRIAGMYIEFENMADPSDPVAVPTFDRDEGIDYYNDLASSSVRDFLRIPLVAAPAISIAAGYDGSFIDGVTGNVMTFFAQTGGTQGFHGKTFSDSTNSKVFGAALVAMPNFSDQSRDLVFARTYLDVAGQIPKSPSSQIGVTWEVVLE